jgi:hypothetical protein
VSDQEGKARDEAFEGEEELLGGEPPPRDPYTPDTGPDPGEERAYNVLRLAWIVIAIVVAVIVIMVLIDL